MNLWHPSSIQRKLILAFLLLTLGSLSVLTWIDHRIIRRSMEENVRQALGGAATQCARGMDDFFRQTFDNIRTESLLPAFRNYLGMKPERRAGSAEEREVGGILGAFKRRDQVNILSYSLLDEGGLVVVSTYGGAEERSEERQTLYQSVVTGMPYAAPPVFPRSGRQPFIRFICPVRSEAGTVAGFLRLEYNAAVLQKIVYLHNGLLGDSSYAVLLDEHFLRLADGGRPQRLYHPVMPLSPAEVTAAERSLRLPPAFRANPSAVLTGGDQALLRRPESRFFVTLPAAMEGETMQCAAVRMRYRPWLLLYVRPEAESLAALDRQSVSALLVFVALAALAALLAVWSARTIARPLIRLTQAAQEIGRGELNRQVPVVSRDEVGCLTVSFNEMVRNLQTTQENLLTATRRLHVLLDTIPDAVFVHEPNGRIRDINESACRMYGYPAAEMVKVDVEALSGRGFTQDMAGRYIEQAAQSGMVEFEWLARRRDGGEFPVMVRLCRMEVGGEFFVIAVVTDITARKQAEAALAAEKELLSVTLRSITDGVITADDEGRVLLMNSVAENLTGWKTQAAAGRPLSEIFPVREWKTRRIAPDMVAWGIRGRGAEHEDSVFLLPLPAGGECVLSCSVAPLRDRRSSVVGVVLVFRDITQRRRMEEELAKTQKLESLGILAGGIAHDFNNILTAIMGNISLARMMVGHEGRREKVLAEAERAGERARDLTQQLLTFAKGGAPVKKLLDIRGLIQESAGFAVHGANVRCEFSIAADLHAVDVDAGQFNQVLHNLVLNAVQAMPGGGVVRVRAANVEVGDNAEGRVRPGRYVGIEVEDQGEGIAPENLGRIFDPFFTTKPSGSGLGLATCYSILRRHDGAIWVESQPGHGTCFRLLLPAIEHSISTGGVPEVVIVHGRGRILLMDDEEMVRNLGTSMLEHLGYEVQSVADGLAAVAAYATALERGAPFAAVIMDLTIPGGMGGQEAVQRLRELDPGVRAVVSSGYSNDPVMADHARHGFVAMLIKPYRLMELSAVLERVLKRDEA